MQLHPAIVAVLLAAAVLLTQVHQVTPSSPSQIDFNLRSHPAQAQATPVRSADAAATRAQLPFAAHIQALHQRLINVTHTSDRWLRRQRDRADSFVTIINRSALGQFANAVRLVDQLREHATGTLSTAASCAGLPDAGERTERLDWVRGNATAMGAVLVGCSALIHDDLDRLVKRQFYTYYRDLQTQSLGAKRAIFLGFEVYNAVTQQPHMVELMDELVDQAERSFAVYVRPDVEAAIALVAERGRLVVDMATTCAFDVATYYSEMVHAAVAEC